MKRILINRSKYTSNCVLGFLALFSDDGECLFSCDTLEPSVKCVYGCIPTGTYTARVYMSPKFGRYVLLLDGVHGRDGIEIHAGNTYKDTKGCILVGTRVYRTDTLVESRVALDRLLDFIDVKEQVLVEITGMF